HLLQRQRQIIVTRSSQARVVFPLFFLILRRPQSSPLFPYTTLFRSFLNEHESKTSFAEVAEVGFFCFFFHEKKRKVLKVLWFWSALPTASQSTHFMNIKYSVLYFTWKWLPEKAKMPHICAT